ncbi:nucleoside hydrolase [Phycisphaera mikurensis]|uniref:Putative hydrolase n=1 Tax=Phycisphaera mikurensis (strain NBRC 102666 / KCTC 22515 / FYK2301M01) TaxID=1142394 RepID=I0IF28_PHYMF|nr:nucleoside hydrolase [Phycisphaera mikurensis]MBB6441657.1 inosine-uridine nucleoside N-ribohydrolase [Phycisphaera mikurensis]BAM03866.1 putative hydrolase [Phycisphaera mikurensis NBRC 102666]
MIRTLLLALLLALAAPRVHAAPADVWLDVDTANGVYDPDDGIMMIQVFHRPDVFRVRGVSTLFGNATLEEAQPIAEHIVRRYGPEVGVHRGAASAEDFGRETDATRAMAAALREKPMHVLAVGPATNLGTVLSLHPELADRVISAVMVAGRRPGQRFQFSDDQPAPFRDANFEKDVPAMRAVLDSGVNLVLAPWEVTRTTWLDPEGLAVLRESGGAGAWIEATTRYWLLGWAANLGTEGFTPFDTLAAGWFTDPGLYAGVPVSVAIVEGPDDGARPVEPRVAGDPKPFLEAREVPEEAANGFYLATVADAFTGRLLEDLAGRTGEPGPPSDTIWHPSPGTGGLDPSAWDAVASRFVTASGRFDYAGLAADPDGLAQLDAYIAAVADADVPRLTRDAHLATAINAYNAWTVRLILDHFAEGRPPASIMEIPEDERWKAVRWRFGGQPLSLDMLEHLLIRPWFAEPRIHFALVCAAASCPPLRAGAYTAEGLDAQLEEQMRRTHGQAPWVGFEAGDEQVRLTALYKWYGQDFVPALTQPVEPDEQASLLPVVAGWNPTLAAALDAGATPAIAWLPYSWAINTPALGEDAK